MKSYENDHDLRQYEICRRNETNRFCVRSCTYNDSNMPVTLNMLEHLKQCHRRKIEMSDGIYVVDVNGYIGDSVKQEIEYAEKHHKEIYWHSKMWDDLHP